MSATDRFERWKKKLTEAAKELDSQYGITDALEKGAKIAAEGIRKGTEVAAAGVEAAKKEWERLDHEYDIASTVKRATSDVVETAREGAKSAEAKADELLAEAGKYYDRVERATRTAEKTVRAGMTLKARVEQARDWIKHNPGKAAVIGLSVVMGVRAGSAFPRLDAVLLGAGGQGHWLFHSALASYGLQKISERYFSYLKQQEQLIQSGRLTEAEAARVEFQRNMTKYVGAPLIGAFHVAAGATLIAQSLSPGRIVGAPVELILGGNPILTSVWLFSNGLICIHNGYKLFVMAMADEETIMQFVREAKYLLPRIAES
ncbi:MAG: hypothetical protein NZ823_01480 [Blastocatellia bacterium]|nr:hypothetical protein [Blastocatellia bacterium]